MDNSAKALLIAATILLTMILVACGIKIFSSTKDTVGLVDEFGKSLSIASEDATYVFTGYQLIKSSDKFIDNPTNMYYKDYPTSVLLSYDYEYTVSFEYEVIENPNNNVIGCGIGFDNPEVRGIYNTDICYNIAYNDYREGAKGKFSYTFNLSEKDRQKPTAARIYDSIQDKRKSVSFY